MLGSRDEKMLKMLEFRRKIIEPKLCLEYSSKNFSEIINYVEGDMVFRFCHCQGLSAFGSRM